MLSRRDALQVVATLLATERQIRPAPTPLTRRLLLNPGREEVLRLDFGAGAASVQRIELVQGAVTVSVSVADLFAALREASAQREDR